ncbi:complement C1q-like protein 4 [Dreissena polymorpha]|uniref:C1q domain-containing protein n=1 Tax=Dreissena polymorpha TaxID=45954 RepID=A0A9D4LDH3_DREPO|nr:complement C1q-like protein 4 [Dreissena polymorpha]KAH3856535.1 hypothetical protein DPMN_099125 [Dreissena polymorpha]
MVTCKARLVLLGFILYVQVYGLERQSEEPSCYSRFDFEYKLLAKVVALETTAAKLEDVISHIEQKIDDTNKKLVNQNKQLEYMLGSATSVAFQAFLSKNVAFPQISVVIFDVVPVNLGNAYNPITGIFTAPVNGTYLFAMSIGNPTGKPSTIRMKKNQEYIAYAFAGWTSGWDQGSQTTVVRMSVGDVMFVEGENHVSGNALEFGKHSSMTGTLINKC